MIRIIDLVTQKHTMKNITRISVIFFNLLIGLFFAAPTVQAASVGMHVLRPEELHDVVQQYEKYRDTSTPLYITIPFSYDDAKQLQRWQEAFDYAQEQNVVPIVRLATQFNPEINAWEVPNRFQLMQLIMAVDSLQWPQEKRHVIVFNETNHHAEWGGQANPEEFAQLSSFAFDWLNTESDTYVVLPAAMDLAAPNGPTTMEAFTYWNRALAEEPDLLTKIDAWNSHSYPNPGFVGSPTATAQNSLYGYKHEREWYQNHVSETLPIFITETGWDASKLSKSRLQYNYEVAQREAWSDQDIVAITPFLFAGSPGPFAGFSFIDEGKNPTPQWSALVSIWQELEDQRIAERDSSDTITF